MYAPRPSPSFATDPHLRPVRSTRPFLSPIEKKWIAFQLLTALRDARARKVAHGDIKSENILVTSWNWLYLSDFAPHKPTFLPLDDPSDFSFYFDTAGRRTCYLAPERFYAARMEHDEPPPPPLDEGERDRGDAGRERGREKDREREKERETRVTEAMDVFSAGCVIAELFREGAPLFTLSQLFKYREGEHSVDAPLASIDDPDVRDLIREMIALDPAARPAFDTLLHTARGKVFPEAFYLFLHSYVASINELPSPSPFNAPPPAPTAPTVSSSAPSTAAAKAPGATTPVLPLGSGGVLPSDADRRIERVWADYESVEPYLAADADAGEATVMDVRVEYGRTEASARPFQVGHGVCLGRGRVC